MDSVSVSVTLRQRPNEPSRADIVCGFELGAFNFSEFSIVRESVFQCVERIVGGLRYRNLRSSHPPQVKIYCWLEESNPEVRDRYMVPDFRPAAAESPFGNSIHLQILIQNLLHDVVGGVVRVNCNGVWLGDSGSIGEMFFTTPRSLAVYVNQLQMNRSATPAIANQPRSHVRKVEL